MGRIASEPIRAHLLGAPAQETTNDTQTAALNVFLDKFLPSLDLVAYV